jgi:tetratricopeptide (TPR) repeat protein
VAHYNLGLAYQKTGRFHLAEEAYLKAVEIDPGLTEAWVNLGGVRLHNWDFEGCLEASRMAVSQREDLSMAHYNLGQAFLYMNDPDNLVACNKRVIELERDNLSNRDCRGRKPREAKGGLTCLRSNMVTYR